MRAIWLSLVYLTAPVNPYDPRVVHEIPENFRRVGQYYFSAQPYPDAGMGADWRTNEWITLKYFFGIRSVIDLRPSVEDFDANEWGVSHGYVRFLQSWWSTQQLSDPKGLYPYSASRAFQFSYALAVPDNAALETARAEQLLALYVTPGACPILTHCHAGVGRTGQALALLLYALFGVPMESAMVQAGVTWSGVQPDFLRAFARAHPQPGYLASRVPRDCLGQ